MAIPIVPRPSSLVPSNYSGRTAYATDKVSQDRKSSADLLNSHGALLSWTMWIKTFSNRTTAMLTNTTENGVAQELQRIEQEFTAQRGSLAAEAARFEEWQTAWEARQAAIDASLAQLKSRLHDPDQGLIRTALKLYSREESSFAETFRT
ncbi:hypothetical protein SH661x_001682 [Planctomicrobium sp. SH661]|uniref:hypothetical protein n=1 Tax=Planctomicrobium sp. SH661 TaxID=3448124 RepID=UPI003F5CACD1